MVAFLKTHPFNTIPLITPDRKALREALAVQQQHVVKEEHLLQDLVRSCLSVACPYVLFACVCTCTTWLILPQNVDLADLSKDHAL
jgi:hypothetical protein